MLKTLNIIFIITFLIEINIRNQYSRIKITIKFIILYTLSILILQWYLILSIVKKALTGKRYMGSYKDML